MPKDLDITMVKTLSTAEPPTYPAGFDVAWEFEGERAHLMISRGDSMAASGFGEIYADVLVLDNVETTRRFARTGLGTFVATSLESWGFRCGARRGQLMASEQGQLLYLRLGWSSDL
ncbi:hypothetical protein BH09ACT10_BH09ACT10_03510 [soil metagenome]